jgi:hypothetical protein
MLTIVLAVAHQFLTWPAVAFFVAIAYRRPLCEMLGRVRSVRCPGYFEGHFDPAPRVGHHQFHPARPCTPGRTSAWAQDQDDGSVRPAV